MTLADTLADTFRSLVTRTAPVRLAIAAAFVQLSLARDGMTGIVLHREDRSLDNGRN